MVAPCPASGRFEVNEDLGAYWGEWCCIEGERTIHGFVGRQERVEATWLHNVEGHVCLRGKLTPVGNWE